MEVIVLTSNFQSEAEICKKLTEKVIELHNKQESHHNNRKHLAVTAGGDYFIIGDKKFTGCVSFLNTKKG